MIDHIHFQKIDIRCGSIISACYFYKASKPSFQLEIDFGPLGIKRSSAQITQHYDIGTLIGKQVIAVINLPIKQIANFFSECLVLGVVDQENGVLLLGTSKRMTNGTRIS